MSIRWSITRRVIWAVTATVAFFVGMQCVLSYLAMDAQEDSLMDDMLHNEVQRITSLTLRPGLTPVGRLPASPRVSAFLSRGGSGEEEAPGPVRGLSPGLHQLKPGSHTWHTAVVDTEDGRLTVVVDATESEDRVHQFGWIMLSLWMACIVATLFIARQVASLAVSPFVEATRNIARWAPERTADGPLSTDEASVLVETFNRFRDLTDETLAREREFAANLDHEIRTPLTIIRTDAELSAVEGPLNEAQTRRLGRIVALVEQIGATARSTSASTAGRREAPTVCDLRECVATACAPLVDRATAKSLRIEMHLEDGIEVFADRQALLTVCRNVVNNAIEHAAPATLTISGSTKTLVFADDGPGIDRESLPHVFERYHRAARSGEPEASAGRSRGLGLAIARRVCDLQAWRLRAVSPWVDGRGTAFELHLDAA